MKLTIETLFQATLVTFQARLRTTFPSSTARQESTSQVNNKRLIIVLGYGGYLSGVKSENVYGQTYGKISYQSTAGGIERGID